ncbi:MAG TPA: SCO family protein [Povalibacter sp.]|jgi:protein SCO1
MKRLLLALLLICAGAQADAPYPPRSIYNLQAALTDQSGAQLGLDAHRGHPVLITMFYGSCPAACPLLIDTLRSLEKSLTPAQIAQLRVVMISVDPQRDTVQALHTLAQQRRIDSSRWTLARTDESSVRKVAAVLNIQYRELPDGSYNHSSVISLLTPQGEIALQSSVLGKPDAALLDALRALPAAAALARQ